MDEDYFWLEVKLTIIGAIIVGLITFFCFYTML